VTLQEDIGNHFFYVVYFQQPGFAEAELDADVRKSLRMIHFALSGDAPPGLYLQPKPANAKLRDGLIDPDPCRTGSPKRISTSTPRLTATGFAARSTGT